MWPIAVAALFIAIVALIVPFFYSSYSPPDVPENNARIERVVEQTVTNLPDMSSENLGFSPKSGTHLIFNVNVSEDAANGKNTKFDVLLPSTGALTGDVVRVTSARIGDSATRNTSYSLYVYGVKGVSGETIDTVEASDDKVPSILYVYALGEWQTTYAHANT